MTKLGPYSRNAVWVGLVLLIVAACQSSAEVPMRPEEYIKAVALASANVFSYASNGTITNSLGDRVTTIQHLRLGQDWFERTEGPDGLHETLLFGGIYYTRASDGSEWKPTPVILFGSDDPQPPAFAMYQVNLDDLKSPEVVASETLGSRTLLHLKAQIESGGKVESTEISETSLNRLPVLGNSFFHLYKRKGSSPSIPMITTFDILYSQSVIDLVFYLNGNFINRQCPVDFYPFIFID